MKKVIHFTKGSIELDTPLHLKDKMDSSDSPVCSQPRKQPGERKLYSPLLRMEIVFTYFNY